MIHQRKLFFLIPATLLITSTLMGQSPNPSLGEANRAVRFEQFQKAKTLLNAISGPVAYYFLGDVYFKEGALDSADQFFNKALSTDPTSPFGYIGLGRMKMSSGLVDEARSQFAKANSLLANNYYAMIELGKAYIEDPSHTKEADANAAITILTKAANMKLKVEPVYLALGDAYLAKPDGENAAKNYNLAIVSNPSSAEPYAKFAKLFRSARNSVVSLNYASQGIAKDPNFGPIYREQAETFRASNKYAEAVNSYEKYLSLTDRSINSRVRYIQFLYLDGNYDKANAELSNLKSILKGNFSSTPAMYRLDAISKYELGTKNKDMKMLSEGLVSEQKLFAQKIVKPLAIDYTYLGKLYRANGNDSLAIKTLEQAVIQDSAHAEEIYPSLIDLYLSKRKYKEAAAIYSKKIDHGDTSINNYVPFAFYTYRAGDTSQFRKADLFLEKVTTKKPSYVDAWVYRGYLNAALDPETKTDKAQPFFQKVIDLSGSDSSFQKKITSSARYKTFLINAYEYMLYNKFKKKDKAQTKIMAEKLKELDPNNAKAEAYLKQKEN